MFFRKNVTPFPQTVKIRIKLDYIHRFSYICCMTLADQTKTYLLRFLTGLEDEDLFRRFRIGYTDEPDRYEKYNLVFVPSGFFSASDYGTVSSLPAFPLPEIEGVPFLYGKPVVERKGNTLVVHADLPASAFFLLSRYEEICLRKVRDRHGRYPGKESVLYANNLMHRPIVDEYGLLIRRWLRDTGVDLPEPAPGIAKLWLTHDVDAPFFCQSLRALGREAFKGKGPVFALRSYFQDFRRDPFYTFDWMEEQVETYLHGVNFPIENVYFFKAGGDTVFDRPRYSLFSRKIQYLLRDLDKKRASFGLHGSYLSGKQGASPQEKRKLERATKHKVFFSRNHFLRSCEPEHFRSLKKIGITDDFTMGYADVAGFRLGTCRPVLWIDPLDGRLTDLLLHPLTVMDCTLYNKAYMHLDEEKARQYCRQLFLATARYRGEICLLWHNSSLSDRVYPAAPVPWARRLYTDLLDFLGKMSES